MVASSIRRRRWSPGGSACALALALGACSSTVGAADAAYQVTVVTPPASSPYVVPMAIGRDGAVVGYAGAGPDDPDALPVRVGADGTLTVLDGPGAVAWASAGDVVVGEAGGVPARWSADGRRDLVVPAPFTTGTAVAVDDRGWIAGSVGDLDDVGPVAGTRPCVWTSAEAPPRLLAVLDPAWPIGRAWAIGADHQLVGEVVTEVDGQVGFTAVRWRTPDAAAAPLPRLVDQRASYVRAIGPDGAVAGYAELLGHRLVAFVARDPDDGDGDGGDGERGEGDLAVTIEILPGLPDGPPLALALGITDAGDVVGLALDAAWQPRAVLWRDGEIVDLHALVMGDVDEPRLIAAVGVDDAGRIAVEAAVHDPPGSDGPWIARIALLTPDR
ncbi:MAG: hypothetical protein H6709_13720 [Kofleriaceae bacterium]|nr:hypothetical protein [Kofleriaceae bacterium]MCB9573137.1 hypothetical protein [Kofleriaceae bacterium]